MLHTFKLKRKQLLLSMSVMKKSYLFENAVYALLQTDSN